MGCRCKAKGDLVDLRRLGRSYRQSVRDTGGTEAQNTTVFEYSSTGPTQQMCLRRVFCKGLTKIRNKEVDNGNLPIKMIAYDQNKMQGIGLDRPAPKEIVGDIQEGVEESLAARAAKEISGFNLEPLTRITRKVLQRDGKKVEEIILPEGFNVYLKLQHS